MKTISIIILNLSLSIITSAAQPERLTLLDCNVYSGDFQQIVVYQEPDSRLTLYRLKSSGASEESSLPIEQWLKQKITIPCPRSNRSCGTVYNSRGDWAYSLGEAGFMSHGFCR